jgi:hypothetical protein
LAEGFKILKFHFDAKVTAPAFAYFKVLLQHLRSEPFGQHYSKIPPVLNEMAHNGDIYIPGTR